MTTKQFESWLRDWLSDTDPIRRIETFEEVGVLTTDRGLVVTFEDGSEVQVTLVRSRQPRNERGHDRMVGEGDDDDGDDDGTRTPQA